jgi:O-methyltransferase
MKTILTTVRKTLSRFGFDLYRLPVMIRDFGGAVDSQLIPDGSYYRPLFSPWLGYGDFPEYYHLARSTTLVSPDRCWILYCLCRQSLSVHGDVWECGVYKGGTAAMLARIVSEGVDGKRLHLFDTFGGMPETDGSIDLHRKGDFSDTTVATVREQVKFDHITVYHQGFIPDTFKGLEASAIAFAHVDVDIWKSVMDCCTFIYPRLSLGGFMVFDDYGFPSCPGARKAVDEYFSTRSAVPLVLPTGQAVVFKSIG